MEKETNKPINRDDEEVNFGDIPASIGTFIGKNWFKIIIATSALLIALKYQ